MAGIAHIPDGLHDGRTLHRDTALIVENGRVAAIEPVESLPQGMTRRHHDGVLCPAFADLQANGGGGVMFNDLTTPDGLRRISDAHASIGTGALLPTLITDTPERTRAAVGAVRRIIATGDTVVAGLHLEGPHLSIARKGAHDPGLIRAMTAEDLALLCDAAQALPALMVTLAPESVTPAQMETLSRAGAIVSLGHTDADYETCRTAFRAGASCVTHLYNAMSQLGHRAPGLVGAALDTPGVAMGLIADGIHVHPAAIRTAMRAAPGRIFLVTDAMAMAGSDIDSFTLNGRVVTRGEGRLTLDNGTLAGADLEMARAISVMVDLVGCALEEAITMATTRPAALLGNAGAQASGLRVGDPVHCVLLHGEGRATRLSA